MATKDRFCFLLEVWKDLILIKFLHLVIMLDFLLLYVHQYDIINSCVCSYKKTV